MTARIVEQGVYPDVPAEEYHRDEFFGEWSLSSSGARQIMLECPAKFAHDKRNPPESTKAMSLGSVAHGLVLEGKRIQDTHIIVPPGFSMKHTNVHAALIERIKTTKLPTIGKEDAATVMGMHDALLADPIARAAFVNGKAEQSIYWRDEYFNIWCRCRLDWTPANGTIYPDYKSIASAEPEAIRRAIKDRGYHMQDAWACEAIRAAGLCESPTLLWVFQEKDPPYLVTPVVLSEAARDWGARLNWKAKELFAHGLRTGHWGGYCDDVITLDLPGYETKRLTDLDEMGRLAIEAQAPANGKAFAEAVYG